MSKKGLTEQEYKLLNLERWIQGILIFSIFISPLFFYRGGFSMGRVNVGIQEFAWSKSLLINIFGFLALFLWLKRGAVQKRLEMPMTHTMMPVFVFATTVLLSFTRTINPYKGFDLIFEQAGTFLTYGLIISTFRTKVAFKWLAALSLTGLLVGIYGILQFHQVLYLPNDQYGQANATSSLGLTNFSAEVLITILPISFVLIIIVKDYFLRFLASLSFLTAFYYYLICYNRAGFLAGIGASVTMFVLFLWWRARKKGMTKQFATQVAACTAIFLVGFTAFLFLTDIGSRTKNRFLQTFHFGESDIQFRLESWKGTLHLFEIFPLQGVGIGNLEVTIPRYQSEKLEWMTTKSNTRVDRCHNDYLEILAEMGIIGITAFAWFMFALFRSAWRIFSRAGEDDIWYLLGPLCGAIAVFIDIGFSFALEVPPSAFYFWMAVGLVEAQYAHFNGPYKLKEPERREGRAWRIERLAASRLKLGITTAVATLVCSAVMYYSVISFVAEVSYKEGQAYISLEQWDTAIKKFTYSLEWRGFSEAAYYDRAFANIKLNKFQEAEKDLDKCLALVPYFGKAHKVMGVIYENLGKYKEAIEKLNYSVTALPSRKGEIYREMTQIYIRLKQYQNAIDVGMKAKAAESPDSYLLFQMGTAYFAMNKFSQAATEFENSLRLNPSNMDIYLNLSICYLNLKEYDRAVALVRQGIDKKPENPVLHYQLAQILSVKGDKAEAKDALKRALNLNPQLENNARQDPSLSQLLGK
jgi:tetratricopeptide (TPR) repeat protein